MSGTYGQRYVGRDDMTLDHQLRDKTVIISFTKSERKKQSLTMLSDPRLAASEVSTCESVMI